MLMMKKKTVMYLAGGLALALFLGVFSIDALSGIVSKGKILGKDVGGAGGFSIASGSSDLSAGSADSWLIDNLVIRGKEMYSESENNANGGSILVYEEGVDPSSSTASAKVTLTIGTAYTGNILRCDKKYRYVYENASEAYSFDFGDNVLIPCSVSTKEQADALVDLTDQHGWKREEVATLSDILDETATATGSQLSTTNPINGQQNTTQWTVSGAGGNELHCRTAAATNTSCTADQTLVYNETNGDGQFYVDLTFAAAGSDAHLKDPVACFVFDATSPPEGNEMSTINIDHRTGNDLAFPDSVNWATVFTNEDCVKSKTPLPAGTSGTYRFTFTVNEANLDNAGDLFQLAFDDLGDYRANDAGQNRGATADLVSFDSGS